MPTSFGFALRTSTACSLPEAMAKTVRPSVLTMSGSSTPASWTFVCENSGVDSFTAADGDPWAVVVPGTAVGAGIAPSATAEGGGGGASSTSGTSNPARVGTPVRPPVRRAFVRA